jgi:hypothetical protein
MTVSGFTSVSVSAHRDHVRESRTQNARSIGTSCSRFVLRRRTASCWRSARFSATRLALGRTDARSAPRIASSSSSTVLTLIENVRIVSNESAPMMRYTATRRSLADALFTTTACAAPGAARAASPPIVLLPALPSTSPPELAATQAPAPAPTKAAARAKPKFDDGF